MHCSIKGCSLPPSKNHSKCIFHCDKTQENNWVEKFYRLDNDENREYENKKSKWNREKVKLFWSQFVQYINSIEDKDITIKDFIFPIYWIEQYEHENIYTLFITKNIFFIDCIFLDYFKFEDSNNSEPLLSIRFRGCKFFGDLNIQVEEFKNYCALLWTTHQGNIYISSHFKDLFEVTRIECNKKLLLSGCTYDNKCEIICNEQSQLDVSIDYGKFHELVIRSNSFNSLDITDSEFKKLKIIDLKCNGITLENNDFSEDTRISFENVTTETFNIYQLTQDAKFIIFDHIKVNKELNLSNSEFKNTYFNDFNIENTSNVQIEKVSFIDSHLNSFQWGNISKINAPKEMFRQLKYVNDSQGNYIEANNFYVMEMKKHHNEIKAKKWLSPYWQDKLIFHLNEKISDFSRSWFLPLIWFMVVSVMFTLGIQIHKHGSVNVLLSNLLMMPTMIIAILIISLFLKEIFGKKNIYIYIYFFELSLLVLYLSYGYVNHFNPFNEFANFINPKIHKCYENYSFLWFLHKALSGFIIYHFVVALRRQTKR